MTERSPDGYYQWLNFNSPMTDQTADRLVTRLAATKPSRILDVGCGWAELLLRFLIACPTATGHGVDSDGALISRATANASDRGLLSRLTFADRLGDERPADLVINIGAEHVFGTIDQALVRLFNLVVPGGRLLLGTQIWEQPPTADLVAEYGRLPNLAQLTDGAVDHGWRPLDLTVASADDWDHFEFGYLNDWEQSVMAPTTRSQADEARTAADQHRRGYLARRGIFGFAFLTLGRPMEPLEPTSG